METGASPVYLIMMRPWKRLPRTSCRYSDSLLPLAAWLLLATPLLRDVLESAMYLHMLVQLPLLAVLGALVILPWRKHLSPFQHRHDPRGIALLLLAIFMAAFWMLPRSLDAALETTTIELFKFISLPVLVGMPLVLAWSRLHVIARAFVFGNFLSMLAVLGWLYLAAPVRLCNFYADGEQVVTGKLLLLVALAGLLLWFARAVSGFGIARGCAAEIAVHNETGSGYRC